MGDRGALARLLTFVEAGGERSRAVARLRLPFRPPLRRRADRRPGGRQVDPGRPAGLGGAGRVAGRRGPGDTPGAPAEPVDEVGVLAVDPTSPFSGGAILGDRARMQRHATDASIFIRSMATRGHLGGLALAVPDALRVLGAAGLPVSIVETVGVGQVEVEVAAASDTTVVVVTPGWGDSLQAAKAGLLEVADVFVINKADRPGATEAARDLRQMLSLGEMLEWVPPIVETVATTGLGVDELWAAIAAHRCYLASTGLLETRRRSRLEQELRKILLALLHERVALLAETPAFADALAGVRDGTADPYEVAERLLATPPDEA